MEKVNNKKTKYNHVGRPTNEEVQNLKKKHKVRVVGIVLLMFSFLGLVTMFFFSDDISFEVLMGKTIKSHYSENMKKIQNSEDYTLVTFVPQKVGIVNYSRTKIGNEKFISYLFKTAGYADTDKYKWTTIKFYYNGKYVTQVHRTSKKVIIPQKYAGKTMSLKLYVKNKKNKNKPEATYMRMNVQSHKLKDKLSCNLFVPPKIELDDFWWPIGVNNEGKPISTSITSGRTFKTSHLGLDINAGGFENVPIIASYDGKIYKIGKECRNGSNYDYGTYVVLEHDYHNRKVYSIYGHMVCGSIPKEFKVGMEVKAGTKLGIMGDTGNAFGVHLHYEVRDGSWSGRTNSAKNPQNYISSTDPYPGGAMSCQLNK